MGGSLRIFITDRSYLLCMRVVVIKKCHSTVYICRGKDVVCVCMASRGFVGGGRGLKQPALPGLSLLLPRRSDISNCLYLLMLLEGNAARSRLRCVAKLYFSRRERR